MSWGEAVRLTRILRADPGSMLAAAIEGWKYPMPREVAILADLYDLEYAKTGVKNRERYPRPYEVNDSETTRHGRTGGRTPEQVKELLRTAFGQPEGAPV